MSKWNCWCSTCTCVYFGRNPCIDCTALICIRLWAYKHMPLKGRLALMLESVLILGQQSQSICISVMQDMVFFVNLCSLHIHSPSSSYTCLNLDFIHCSGWSCMPNSLHAWVKDRAGLICSVCICNLAVLHYLTSSAKLCFLGGRETFSINAELLLFNKHASFRWAVVDLLQKAAESPLHQVQKIQQMSSINAQMFITDACDL